MNSRETNARKSMAAKWVAESNASREARQAAAVAEQTPSVMQAFGVHVQSRLDRHRGHSAGWGHCDAALDDLCD